MKWETARSNGPFLTQVLTPMSLTIVAVATNSFINSNCRNASG